MALSAGGTRLVVAAGSSAVVWDAVLDVDGRRCHSRSRPPRCPSTAIPLFFVEDVSNIGLTSQRFLTLPEEPSAIRAGAAPAAAEDVRALQIADGVATFVERALGRAPERLVAH